MPKANPSGAGLPLRGSCGPKADREQVRLEGVIREGAEHWSDRVVLAHDNPVD